MTILENLWAGTEASYLVATNAYKQAEAKAGVDLPDGFSIYERQGTVGVVTIKGSLMPGNAGWMAYYGVIGYNDIRTAVLEAVADPNTTSILMMYQSGGGAVTGMTDTADFLRQAGKLKPMVAYVDVAASAAYRLAIESSSIIVSDSGVTGSIGVLRIHSETSKMMETDGIKVTVLRAGEFKALLNPYEALTPEAIAQEEERLGYLANIFNQAVQDRRGLTADDMRTKAGEGREFLGQMGVAVGLADRVGNYELALELASKGGKAPKVASRVAQTLASSLDTPQNAANNSHNTDMTKPTFTAEQLASLAEGTDPTPEALVAEVTSVRAELATAQTDLATAQTGTAAVQVELAAAQASLTATQATVQAQASAMVKQVADLESTKAIVVASLQNMAVALGSAKESVDATASLEVLLAEHTKTAEAYSAKFKVGGVAAVAPAEKESATPKRAPTGLFAAFVSQQSTK